MLYLENFPLSLFLFVAGAAQEVFVANANCKQRQKNAFAWVFYRFQMAEYFFLNGCRLGSDSCTLVRDSCIQFLAYWLTESISDWCVMGKCCYKMFPPLNILYLGQLVPQLYLFPTNILFAN